MCSDKMKCPICENGYLRQQTSKNGVSYKNQTTKSDLRFSVCKFCGSEQVDDVLVQDNKRAMIEINHHD